MTHFEQENITTFKLKLLLKCGHIVFAYPGFRSLTI